MNKKVIITRGLSGAGKTTWSKQYVKDHPDFLRISRDDIDFMLSDNYPKKKEQLIFRTRDYLIGTALSQGFDLVLDETYLVPDKIEGLNLSLKAYTLFWHKHLDVQIQDFLDVQIEQCIKRDKERFFHVGEEFIKRYYKEYVEPLLTNRGITEWTV